MGQRESANVEDRRGGGGAMLMGGGMGTLVIALVAMFFGVDPRLVLQQAPRTQQVQQGEYRETADEAEKRKFVSVVLADTEDVWNEQFRRQLGRDYREPKLVMFTGAVQSACGMGQSAMGPFYCPEDENVYIDLSFYDQLKQELGAPGDFAQAYVVAHEVGHHIQHQLGVFDRYRSTKGAEGTQVRIELQADFYAGVWAHYAMQEGIVESGDLEEALNAAAQIGDDRLQKRSQGMVVPDSFTHGTSDQRARWFLKGYKTGDMRQGDTFNTSNL